MIKSCIAAMGALTVLRPYLLDYDIVHGLFCLESQFSTALRQISAAQTSAAM